MFFGYVGNKLRTNFPQFVVLLLNLIFFQIDIHSYDVLMFPKLYLISYQQYFS